MKRPSLKSDILKNYLDDIMAVLFPDKQSKIHLSGIGGVMISAFGNLLANFGYTNLQGSNLGSNNFTDAWEKAGHKFFSQQEADNITSEVTAIIRSTAVKEDNPEIIRARELNIPVYSREETLQEILSYYKHCFSCTGCHGKTSTSAMAVAILDACGLQPSALIGGISNKYNSNLVLGGNDWMVIEADESDGTFNKVKRSVGLINNIGVDHLESYHNSFAELQDEFVKYANGVEADGLLVLNADDQITRQIRDSISFPTVRSYTLDGQNMQADTLAYNIRQTIEGLTFDLQLDRRGNPKEYKDLFMPMFGTHQVANVCGILTAMNHLGYGEEQLRTGLRDCLGTQRRFTKVGEVNGAVIIDDYAHHPDEIAVTLQTAKSIVGDKGRVIAVCQPHRYTRLNDVLEEFSQCWSAADQVILADIFSVREKREDFPHLSQAILVDRIAKQGFEVECLDDLANLAQRLAPMLKLGDLVVCLGAGDISKWARSLATDIQSLQD